MKSTWLLILMVMLTVQSLGLSHAAPVYYEPDANMAMDTNSSDADMPCHSGGVDNDSAEIVDCCAEQDCSCCWGCSGLMNALFKLGSIGLSANSPMIEATRSALSGIPTSLYRPPIFA